MLNGIPLGSYSCGGSLIFSTNALKINGLSTFIIGASQKPISDTEVG